MSLKSKRHQLTPADVCLIIRESSHAGVAELKWGDLQITFGVKSKPTLEAETVPPATVEQQNQVEKESIEQDELVVKQADLERMKIEDPVAFENLIAAGDLVDQAEEDMDGETHVSRTESTVPTS